MINIISGCLCFFLLLIAVVFEAPWYVITIEALCVLINLPFIFRYLDERR